MNIAYELEGVCTSIVAQDSDGNVFHARNLDFGLFFGWDQMNHTWRVAELLRPLLFNARFVSGGKELYRAVAYAGMISSLCIDAHFTGFVGLLTGMKTGAFSISVDTRFDNNLDRGLFKWFEGDHSGHFLTFTTRYAIENAATYDEAFQILNSTKLIGPGYIILGGAKAGEGVVFTREEEKSIKPLLLSERILNGSFYVLETNYDWWVQPPFFDDRRFPAEDCLNDRVKSTGVSFESLFNVLSARPNLNLLTTYTALMQVSTGRMESYKQACEWPCPMW
jgi:acid ceramidase